MILLKRMPLATRVALLFASVTAVVFSIAGAHLYQSLSEQQRSGDDVVLLSTVVHQLHLLQQFAGIDAVRANPAPLLADAPRYEGLMMAVRDSEGRLIAASSKEAEQLPTISPVDTNRRPDETAINDWYGGNGKRGRIISVWGQTGQEPSGQVLLIVARDNTGAVVRSHRDDVLLTMLLGVVAVAFLGYLIATHGLRPIQAVAKAASHITASQLGERLSIEEAPAELEGMIASFNQMLDRLEDSFQRLTQFSSDIAHDLRTPISNLMIETQVALTQRRSIAEYESLLASNVEEFERLTRMIENLLFLARADNAQVALQPSVVVVKEELQRIVGYFDGMADEAGVELVANATGTLLADPLLLRRAISNLVVNAIRHTPRGGRIVIQGKTAEDGRAVIAVSNTGSGIAPDHLTKIFDRFYRVDASRSASRTSSGLGLAIVKSIMALHNGKVNVESALNGLTTFSLVFPPTALVGTRDA